MGCMKLHTTSNGELIRSRYYPQHRRGHEARGDRQPLSLVPFLRGILWKLRSGARWELCRNVFLPIRLFTDGCNIGEKQAHLKRILFALANIALEQGKLGAGRRVYRRNLCSGQRGSLVGRDQKGKGTKIIAIVEEHGYPIALHIESASPGEATLVEKTVEAKFIDQLPPPFNWWQGLWQRWPW